MKVLMLPDYSRFNPYQKELVAALDEYGVHVTLCSFNTLPILKAVRAHGKPAILHLHWTDSFIVADNWPKTIMKTLRFFLELLIVKIMGIKVVWTVHNLSNHEKNNSVYESFVNRILVQIYDRLIVHCSAARTSAASLYHLTNRALNKVKVVPHGNYVNSYQNDVTKHIARDKFGYKEEDIVFLFLGSVRPYKGIFDLIDAFRNVKSSRAKLLIAGKPADNSMKDELLLRCQNDDRINAHLQYIEDSEVQVYMNSADVTVFPYTDILTSGSVLLAMSFGKAIIVPQIGCISETLDSQGAFLYNPHDVNGLSQAIQSALQSNLSTMGQYNRVNAENFSWQRIAQMTFDVYSNSSK
jgi:beta-1,4-mannosyltransferase